MRNRLLIVAIFAVFVGAGYAAVWDGTANTDWYSDSETNFTITTAEELAGLAQLVNDNNVNFYNKTITLDADITLNDTLSWKTWTESNKPTSEWTGIGTNSYSNSFSGTFDGKGHVISGIYGDGLFKFIRGDIKNLGVKAFYVYGTDNVGGLVGSGSGTINNSYAIGTVNGTINVGGLVGDFNASKMISNSYAIVTVTGTNNVGGLVGNNTNGTISNSYATGTVTAATEGTNRAGGLVGNNNSNIKINNSYAACNVVGFITSAISFGGTVSNSYYDNTIYTVSYSIGTGKATSYMKSQDFVELLNGEIPSVSLSMNKWVYVPNGYPKLDNPTSINKYLQGGSGKENDPYIISTNGQLGNFSTLVNDGYDFSGEYLKLSNDIMINDTTNWKNWATTVPSQQWKAIGASISSPFNGTFDGDGHIISGIYINYSTSSTSFQGLFGYVKEEGVIKNLGVKASYIKVEGGNSVGVNVGGLVGEAKSIYNSYSMATVTVTGIGNIGGLIGNLSYNGTIQYCYAAGKVTAAGATIGGLVGNTSYSASASDSYYDKDVSEKNDTGKGTGKTTTEMKAGTTYSDWDFNEIWGINPSINNGYPYLRVPVKNIVLTADTSGAYYQKTITLKGDVQPDRARQKTIAWSVVQNDISKASITEGNKITFNAAGEITVKATIVNGLRAGSSADNNYVKEFKIKVKKIDPTPTTPSNLTATYGQTLADVIPPLSGSWSWEKITTTSVGNAGEQTYNAIYNLNDPNYNILTIPLKVKVTKATPPTVTFPTATEVTYNPTATLSNIPLNEGSGDGTFAWETGTTIPTVKINSYNVTFAPRDATNYDYAEIQLTKPVTLTVNKATPTYTPPTSLSAIYGQTLSEVIGLTDGWVWDSPTSLVGAAGGTRTHPATFTPVDTNNYNIVSGHYLGVTVSKASGAILSKPTLASKTSNSITIKAIYASTAQEVEYAISTTATAPNSPEAWKKIPPTDTTLTFQITTVPMEYYIFARAQENDNYLASSNSEPLLVWVESGGAITHKYCVLNKGKACLTIGTSYKETDCPAVGTLSETCPYSNIVTPINQPKISTSNIQAKATTNSIILENLPQNAKVEVYNLQGKRIYSAHPENPKILTIGVQTKGMYIVKVNNNILRVLVM